MQQYLKHCVFRNVTTNIQKYFLKAKKLHKSYTFRLLMLWVSSCAIVCELSFTSTRNKKVW